MFLIILFYFLRKAPQLCEMPHAYQIHKQDAAYFLTLTAVEWLDVFMRREQKLVLCDSLNYCIDKKGLEVFAYVIMSTHMHMIVRSKFDNLSDIIRDFKKYTSSRIIKELQTENESRKEWMMEVISKGGPKQKKKSKHQLWQYNNHAVEVFSPKFIMSKIRYIHNNPIEAGLCDRPEDYLFSSARDYADNSSPVKVTMLELHSLI